MKQCKLCGNFGDLCDSHVMPKFAVKWLRKTLNVEVFRCPENINKPRQDGVKLKMLCPDCEQRFSVWENYFAQKIFNPYLNFIGEGFAVPKELAFFEHDERLLKFAISLHWRLLEGLKSVFMNPDKDAKLIKTLSEMLSTWQDFLLDKRKDTGPWKSYYLLMWNVNLISNLSIEQRRLFLKYLFATCADGDIPYHDSEQFLYAKVGPFIFITAFVPRKIKGLADCTIRWKGKISTSPFINNRKVLELFTYTRPTEVAESFSKLSPQQSRQIDQRFEKNKSRILSSPNYKAIVSDKIFKIDE